MTDLPTPEPEFYDWLARQTPASDAQAFQVLTFYQAWQRLPDKGDQLFPDYLAVQLRYSMDSYQHARRQVQQARQDLERGGG